MPLDIFGRGGGETVIKAVRGPSGIGFKLTSDDQYDIQNKRLCKVAEAREPEDAVNLRRLRKAIASIKKEVREEITAQDSMLKTIDHRLNGFKNAQDITSKEELVLDQRQFRILEHLENRISKLEQWIKPT